MALDFTSKRIDDLDDMAAELGDLVDSEGNISGGTLLDEIVAEILTPVEDRAPFTTDIPSRPGWTIDLRVDLSKRDKELLATQAKRISNTKDTKKLLELDAEAVAFSIALLCVGLSRKGQPVTVSMIAAGGADTPATFRSREWQTMLGVDSASKAARKFIGDEALAFLADRWQEARGEWPDDDGGPDPRP